LLRADLYFLSTVLLHTYIIENIRTYSKFTYLTLVKISKLINCTVIYLHN